jgi:hypothetical protein
VNKEHGSQVCAFGRRERGGYSPMDRPRHGTINKAMMCYGLTPATALDLDPQHARIYEPPRVLGLGAP